MAQKIEDPAAKPDHPSSVPRTHMAEEETLPGTFISMPRHKYTHIHTNKKVHMALVQSLVSYSAGQQWG